MSARELDERQHVNRDGTPKKVWPTWTQAQRYADALVIMKPHMNRMDAYRCSVCGDFHIGTTPRSFGLVRVELGPRAAQALFLENQRKESGRRYAVHRRARAAVSIIEREQAA